jgi:hypothetical protein
VRLCLFNPGFLKWEKETLENFPLTPNQEFSSFFGNSLFAQQSLSFAALAAFLRAGPDTI